MVIHSNHEGSKENMDNKMNTAEIAIITKLFAIRNEIEQVDKKAQDAYHKSSYVSDAQVVALFKPLFKKHNLFFIRTRNWSPEKDLYEVTMTYYDIDNHHKFAITDDVPITSKHTQGYGALTTYLTRYFNLELFFVETVIDSTYETKEPEAKVEKKNPFADKLKGK